MITCRYIMPNYNWGSRRRVSSLRYVFYFYFIYIRTYFSISIVATSYYTTTSTSIINEDNDDHKKGSRLVMHVTSRVPDFYFASTYVSTPTPTSPITTTTRQHATTIIDDLWQMEARDSCKSESRALFTYIYIPFNRLVKL